MAEEEKQQDELEKVIGEFEEKEKKFKNENIDVTHELGKLEEKVKENESKIRSWKKQVGIVFILDVTIGISYSDYFAQRIFVSVLRKKYWLNKFLFILASETQFD